MPSKHTGQCACGAIRFAFDTDPQFIANCHCNDCKRASGGEMATFFGVAAPGNFEAEKEPKTCQPVASSPRIISFTHVRHMRMDVKFFSLSTDRRAAELGGRADLT